MSSKDLLKSILESFYGNGEHCISYLSLTDRLMNEVQNVLDDDVVAIDLKYDFEPLKPFLEIVKEEKPEKRFLDKILYNAQAETFKSYFKNGVVKERKDLILFDEVFYEKIRIREAILELLKKYATRNIVVLNAHLMSEESILILRELEKETISGKILFLFNGFRLEEYPEYIREFVQDITGKQNYYSIDSEEDFEERFFSKKERLNIEYENLKTALKNQRLFLDLSSAYNIVKRIETDSVLRNYEKSESREIYMEMGLICFLKGDLDLANCYFINATETDVGDELELFANFYMAFVAYRKNMHSVALRYVSKIRQLLKINPHQDMEALNEMMDYIIAVRVRDEYSFEAYVNVIKLLEERGYVNVKLYAALVIPWKIFYDKNLRSNMFEQVKKTLKQAESVDNIYAVSAACHWMGISLTQEGKKEEAYEWYNKCRELRKNMNELSAIIKVTNGLAYEYLIDSNYEKAYDLINGFIVDLLESNDYPEIIITLGNIGRALFYARNFDVAYEIFQEIINLLIIFELQDVSFNSFLPEYNDIVIYKSIIDFFRGEYTRAKMNLYNVTHNEKSITPVEEILKVFLKSCVELNEGDLAKSMATFEEGIVEYYTVGYSQEHRLSFMYYEYALLLKKSGYEKESEIYLKRGFELASKYNLVYYTQKKNKISIFDYLENVKRLEPLKLDLKALEEKAEKDRLLNQLNKRLRDSQFLNKLISYSMDIFSEQKYVSNASQAVFDYTTCDAVFIAEKNAKGWEIRASSLRGEIEAPSKDLWNELLKQTSNVTPEHIKRGNDRDILFINLSKFEFTGGIIIYLQRKLWLSAEEMNTLNLAVNNIQSQLVMFKQNQRLTMISSTDPLSQLKNRHALQEHLAIESELLERYEKKNPGSMYESIAFMDMDNFKYYNDTFGHEAGDLLISCMGKLLNEIFRKVDFVSRYGGDEFVIVLPRTTTLEAKRSGERLYEALEKEKNFIPALEKLLNRNVKIPDNKKLGFSIGICCTTDNNDVTNIEETMIKADKALYYSKQHKKGTITIWSDIKDKIDITGETSRISIKE